MNTMQQQNYDNMFKYQVAQEMRPVKNVPILMPDGRTKMVAHSPETISSKPPTHGKGKKSRR